MNRVGLQSLEFAVSPLHPRRMGAIARRHSADADDRRSAQAAVDARSDLARRSGRHLSAAVAAARALRCGDAGPVQGDPALSRRNRRQGALHHRHCRIGRRGKIDDRPRAAGAADPLAEYAAGAARHHRRLFAPQRRADPLGDYGPQGVSGELRRDGGAAVSVGGEGGTTQCRRSRLFAYHLRHRERRIDRRRPTRHSHLRGHQRPAAEPPAARRQGDSVRLRLFRFLDLPRRRRPRCWSNGTSSAS